MRVLVVYAHPEPSSFNAALRDTAVDTARGAGHDIAVSDLYASAFDPAAGRHDFLSVADPKRFHYQTEQELAARSGRFNEAIAREQGLVAAADLMILQFPLWWGGPPAMLKGWIDRVLAYGFAYVDGRRFDTGLFKGKRGLLSVTTGGTPARFGPDGAYGEIEKVLWPLQRLTLEYMGIEAAAPFICYGAPRIDAAGRKACLAAWRERLLEELARPLPQATPAPARTDGAAAWSRPG